MSTRYTERWGQADIRPSVGIKGGSYAKALAETINGLFKAELIHRWGRWKTKEYVELANCSGCTGPTTPDCSNQLRVSLRQKREAYYVRQLANRNTSTEVSTETDQPPRKLERITTDVSNSFSEGGVEKL